MMFVTAKKPSRKLTSVVASFLTCPLLSTPTVIMVNTVATKTLKNASYRSVEFLEFDNVMAAVDEECTHK
jgi:hypothetical protein